MSPVATTVFTALATAAIGYVIGVLSEFRKTRLSFVNSQIEKLYGPLYALSYESRQTFELFRRQFSRPGRPYFWANDDLPTVEEAQTYRHWMTTVFQPLNLRIEETIIQNGHLIEGDKMPEVLMQMIAHTQMYKGIIARWREDDFAASGSSDASLPMLAAKHNTAGEPFPREFYPYVDKTFKKLKDRQYSLTRSLI